jgi:ribosomal protein S18 acetylase RimI-like enzyme
VTLVPRSLVWATDIDVLPIDHVTERREGYLVTRSPGNPAHYWGNFLLFDDAPVAGDGRRWERLFEAEFEREPRVQHRTFAWDRVDGGLGESSPEFGSRGYRTEETVGLVATADAVRPHPRANRDVEIRALDPFDDGSDGAAWAAVIELQVAARDDHHPEQAYREFSRSRLDDQRALFRAGRGAWFVGVDGGQVVASCGLVVTGDRGRFQAVDTAESHRRRGICSRLVVEAAHRTAERHGTEHFVIAADPDYHALGLYESLGFTRTERVAGVMRFPDA